MTRWTTGDMMIWTGGLLGFALILGMNAYWMFFRHEPPSPQMLRISVIGIMMIGLVLIVWAAAITEPAPDGYVRQFEWGDVLIWIALCIGLGLNVGPIIFDQRDLIPQDLRTPGIFLVLAAGVWSVRKNPRRAAS
jgi:hypothetical protein